MDQRKKLVNDVIMSGVQHPGGEVRSGSVDCRCEERSDERIARCLRVDSDARGVTGWRECGQRCD